MQCFVLHISSCWHEGAPQEQLSVSFKLDIVDHRSFYSLIHKTADSQKITGIRLRKTRLKKLRGSEIMCMTSTHTGSLTFRGHAPHHVPLVPLPLRLILFQKVISFTFSRNGVEGHVSKGLSPFERGRVWRLWVRVCAQTCVSHTQ